MRIHCSLITAICLLTVANSPQSIYGQNTAATPQLQQRPQPGPELQGRPPESAEQRSQLVVDVVVTDKFGRPLAGLRPENFALSDNKKSITTAHFQSASGNNSQIVLVIDAINSSRESLVRTENQVKGFLKMNGGHLAQPLSILILSDSLPRENSGNSAASIAALPSRQAFFRRLPPSADGSALIQALDQNVIALSRITEAQGGAGDAERVRLSIQALDAIGTAESKIQGHKVVIWLSPGWPRLARSYAKTKTALFDDVIYFSDLLRDARITLDVINPDGISGGVRPNFAPTPNGSQIAFKSPQRSVPTEDVGPDWYEAYYASVKRPNEADVNDLTLQVLAHQSGGLVLSKDNQIAPQIARCVDEASAYYAISYELSAAGGSADYHELEIKLRAVDGMARMRRGYYAK